MVTIVGGQLGTLLAGTVIVETICALPGMGNLFGDTLCDAWDPRLRGTR